MSKMNTSLDQLKAVTTVVSDSGDFEIIKKFKPTDATTNPSLILAAATLPQYQSLFEKAIDFGNKAGITMEEKLENTMDMLSVSFGLEILKVIPGRVSTEVDARLSFDKEATIAKALKIVQLYTANGISKERILIKVPSTWEGIQAAKVLEEKHGVHVNLTLLFNLTQAVAAADAGATMISPFVNRILEWYVANTDTTSFSPDDHPGVVSVTKIYNYYKKYGHKTEVMAASFHTVEEVIALAGCDLLTVPPELLRQLEASHAPVPRKLSKEMAAKSPLQKIELTEAKFRWLLNEDQMATDQIADGIRNFAIDEIRLEDIIKPHLFKSAKK